MKKFRKITAILCAVAVFLSALSMGTVFAVSGDTAIDYSNIDFDSENGTAGNLNSSVWSFYDAADNAVAGNNTKMLKLKTEKSGNLSVNLLSDGNTVDLKSSVSYSLTFDYYADAGVDVKNISIRNSANSNIITDKSDKWGSHVASNVGISSNGTDGVWKTIRMYFAVDADTSLKVSVSTNTATTDTFMYFDNFSLIELPEEKVNDYSDINFDTKNGATGNLGSSYWSFYDAYNGIGTNNTRMLKVDTNYTGTANFPVNLIATPLYGGSAIPIENGKTYRLDFEYYVDPGVDFDCMTVRSTSGAIATDKNAGKTHNAAMLGITTDGTSGVWKRFRVYFTAPEDSSLKLGVQIKSATENAYIYFDNLSLVELPTESVEDYSNINFDTANGKAGNLSSSYMSFFDAYENGIGGNYSRMLRYYAKGVDNATFNVTYGSANVPLVAEERYRLDFDVYAENGIDIEKAQVRDQSACLKDNIILPVTSEGTNGKWVRVTVFFTAGASSTSLKMAIKSKSATDKYLYIDNISLTPFNSESAITFEGKKSGAAVDSSTSVWKYNTDDIAGNATTKLVFSHTSQASGTVYNDFDDMVAVEKGYYYIIEFDYYMDSFDGTLGAIYNNDIGYMCNLDVNNENGTDGVWKKSTTILKATGTTERFKFSFNPTNASDIKVYIDNVSIVMLYDCSMDAPEIEKVTPNSITVTNVDGYEYSVDGVHFGTNEFKNLNSETGIYPVYCREKVTDSGYPSAPSEPIYIQLPYAGDIDNNRELDVEDLKAVRTRLLTDTADIDEAFFDANRDNSVNILDLINLKKQIAAGNDISTQTTVVRDGNTYTLAWNDDFTGRYIDRNKWANRVSDADSELQYFKNDTDNIFINNDVNGNSCLVLQAVKETVTTNGKTYDYTSGGVDTYGKFDFKTGYVEMRAKLPAGAGLWPGFWFGGTSNRDGNSNWPLNGEIDVFEFYGYNTTTVSHNMHYGIVGEDGSVEHKHINSSGEYKTVLEEGFCDDFHTFGCEWTEEYVAYYVDGVLRYKYEKDPEIFADINNEDMYILVTLAVGAGNDEAVADIENTEFPAQMLIDYVRYYN